MTASTAAVVHPPCEPTGWGEPGLPFRHSEAIAAQWWLDHPDAAELQRRADVAAAELEAATEAARAARAVVLDKPEMCGAKAIGTECHRAVHPLWQQHEDFEGHGWFSGEAPR